VERLRLAGALLTKLDAAGIGYVHWKSNEHLDASLRGETDLDLLVPPEEAPAFAGVVENLGFVAMAAPQERRVPGISAYLGCDTETGTLLHLDVTESLTIGERLLKNHILGVETWLMADPVSLYEVPTPSPEKELIVLFIRCMLKTRWRQLIRSAVKGGSPLPPRIRAELAWLGKRVDPNQLSEAVSTSGLPVSGAEITDFYGRVVDERLGLAYVRRVRALLGRRLRSSERLPRHRAVPKRWWLWLRSTAVMGALGLGVPSRTLTGNGVVVAVVGADGSGKSRLTRDLESWLGAKLGVRHVYFGQPKSGFWYKLLNKPGSLARARQVRSGPLPLLSRYTDPLKWMMLGRHRRRMMRGARQLASKGSIVIAERFPLPEFESMRAPMDGPRLQQDLESPASWARYEQRQYDAIGLPDLLIVLDTDLKTLRSRKLDLGVEEHSSKVAAVSALEPGPGRVILDAGEPYEEVLLEAKTALWETICATR
jgi:hypothetical protein